MVPAVCPLTPMVRLPGAAGVVPLPPSAPARAIRTIPLPSEALAMLNFTVHVVARPWPHCGHGSALLGGVFTQPKRWLAGSLALGLTHAVVLECGTSWKNQSLW